LKGKGIFFVVQFKQTHKLPCFHSKIIAKKSESRPEVVPSGGFGVKSFEDLMKEVNHSQQLPLFDQKKTLRKK